MTRQVTRGENWRGKLVRKMENKKSPEKLNDAELSEKLGYYQFIEVLWSLFTILFGIGRMYYSNICGA